MTAELTFRWEMERAFPPQRRRRLHPVVTPVSIPIDRSVSVFAVSIGKCGGWIGAHPPARFVGIRNSGIT